ncbi:MAG: DUF4349 domain-containing protein [Defluviitaleaceae bacterium]|nr:DUF4349 domain-containing protein [Defluviitaleaceae bacterium]
MKINRMLIIIFAATMLLVTACGGSDESTDIVAEAVPMVDAPAIALEPPPATQAAGGFDFSESFLAADAGDFYGGSISAVPERTVWETPEVLQPTTVERRVIRNSDIDIDTLYFEETVSGIERIIEINGGFIETSEQRYRDFWHADYVIRVPVERFDTVNRELIALGQVTHFTTNSEDVTMLFLDLQSRLSIREEEERRIEAMRDAATYLRDLIALERELSDLRVVVDRYRRRITEIDQLASFSTIRLSVREVEEIVEYVPYVPAEPPIDSFGTRIASAFSASADVSVMLFETIAIIVVSLILPLGLLALPIFGGYIIYGVFHRQ